MKKMFQQFSIRNKLLSILLVIIIIFTGFSLFLIQSIDEISNITYEIKEDNLPELSWLDFWEKQLAIKEHVVTNYLETDSETNIITDYQGTWGEDREQLVNSVKLPEELEEINNDIMLLDFIMMNKVSGLLEYDDEEAAKNVIRSEFLPKLNGLQQQIIQRRNSEFAAFQENSNSFPVIIEKSLLYLILITIIGVSISFYLSYRMSQTITNPIEQMVAKVNEIANGKYGEQITPSDQAEIQQLTKSINQMSSSLQQSFDKIMNDKIKHEQVLNSLPVGIMTYDHTENEYLINSFAQDLLHISNKQLKDDDIFHSNNQNRLLEMFYSEKGYYNEKIELMMNDENHVFLVSQTSLKDQNQEPIGRTFYFVDITETTKLEKRMIQSEKLALVGEMAASSAHEIRNPLTVIHGFLALMAETLQEEDLEKFNYTLMMKEMDRLYSIVEQMLLMSKQNEPNKEKIKIKQVLEELVPLLTNTLHAKGIDLSVQLQDECIYADAKQLKQVLLNLIRNSMEAIESGGNIRISSQVKGKHYELFVEDDGSGIPEHIKKSLFEPFSTSKSNGTGLGLNVVKKIITNHGGDIKVYRSDERGTVFQITFPIVSTKSIR
ncbi:ATP-binding protein [Gracilibacillus sp. YIM 98692]|uniref:sensor histidine kinase n=1 Tax=Gracilibacillus sp. YIM 98692 TaxID=2663532 RepID=UPI0013D2B850|nr:ATP-binding protein [Gracilibacillus sp. YIM 98692]